MVRRFEQTFMLLLAALLVLAACSNQPAVVCNKPYIIHGQECCLDSNSNNICDTDDGLLSGNATATTCPELDCSLCPAQIVEKKVEVPVTKYICERDGSEVSDPAECVGNKGFNAFAHYKPYKGAENRSVLTTFTLRPACRDSKHALELHYAAGTSPENVTIQVKEEPTDKWRDIYTVESAPIEKYLYAAFCANQCSKNVQWFLEPGKVYLLRARFNYQKIYGEDQYSNEYIVDAREGSDYMTKLC